MKGTVLAVRVTGTVTVLAVRVKGTVLAVLVVLAVREGTMEPPIRVSRYDLPNGVREGEREREK